MKFSRLSWLALALVASQGWAQIYKSTDADGNVVFSDTPADSSSEQVQLHQTNTTPPPPTVQPDKPPSTEQPVTVEATVPQATITTPANETTIPMGGGNFSVSAQVEPGLGQNQFLRLLLDGEAQGEAGTSGTWNLSNVFRGAHDLVVEVVDANGSTLSSSAPVRVYVMRPSVR
jgi:Domain of unknown function (DUF4124)